MPSCRKTARPRAASAARAWASPSAASSPRSWAATSRWSASRAWDPRSRWPSRCRPRRPSPSTRRRACMLAPGTRVLVVDDSAINVEILGSQLEAWGFIVTTAASALEAQTHLNAMQAAGTPPKIIVLDWHMPEQNGVDWLLGVRRRTEWKSIPAIMVSSVADDIEAEPRHAARADAPPRQARAPEHAAPRPARGAAGRAVPRSQFRPRHARTGERTRARSPLGPPGRGQHGQPHARARDAAASRLRRHARRQRRRSARCARKAGVRRGAHGLPDAGHGRLHRHAQAARARSRAANSSRRASWRSPPTRWPAIAKPVSRPA